MAIKTEREVHDEFQFSKRSKTWVRVRFVLFGFEFFPIFTLILQTIIDFTDVGWRREKSFYLFVCSLIIKITSDTLERDEITHTDVLH